MASTEGQGFSNDQTPVPDILPDPVPGKPYDMSQLWPYDRFIGPHYTIPAQEEPGNPLPTPLHPIQMVRLKSEHIKDVFFEEQIELGAQGVVYRVSADYLVQRAKYKPKQMIRVRLPDPMYRSSSLGFIREVEQTLVRTNSQGFGLPSRRRCGPQGCAYG